MESTSQQLKFEAESLQKDLDNAHEALEAAKSSLNKASTEEIDLQIQVGQRKSTYDEAKQALHEIEQKMSGLISTIKQITKEKNIRG